MVDLRLVVEIIVGLLSIGTVIVIISNMQTRQNMKIKTLEDRRKEDIENNNERFEKIEKRVSNTISNQIKTEKLVGEIGLTLKHISEGIDELKGSRKK